MEIATLEHKILLRDHHCTSLSLPKICGYLTCHKANIINTLESRDSLALSKHEPISDGGLGMVKPYSWVLGMVEPEILDDHVHPFPKK